MSEPRAAEACQVRPPALPHATIDVQGCSAFEISIALHEHEQAGLRFDTWPAPVRERIGREIEAWEKRNPGRSKRAIVSAVVGRVCKLLVYHAARDAT
jgi:hypothetical protein